MKKSLLLAWLIILFSIPQLVFAQAREISGTVTDENGAPLASVSVIQKGTTNGVTTNERGMFTITVTGNNPVLVFTYSGRQPQEIAVGSSNTYNVSLSASGPMSEVVVTALGIRRSEPKPTAKT